MSFDCRYKTAQDFCERLQGSCRPGTPGCTLYGKVVMAPRGRSLTESVALAMDCPDPELVPYLPYILQDFTEIGSHAASIERIVGELKGPGPMDILDLGCGKGAVLCRLVQSFEARGLGIDALPEFITAARAQAQRLGLTRCAFEVGDLRDTSSLPGRYDFILLASVGPVFESYAQGLRSLKSRLKPQGSILLDEGYTEGGTPHPVTLSRDDLFAQIEAAGLQVVREYRDPEVCEVDEFTQQLAWITRRCEELMARFPEKRDLFAEYIAVQSAEYEALETELVCSTLILQRRPR